MGEPPLECRSLRRAQRPGAEVPTWHVAMRPGKRTCLIRSSSVGAERVEEMKASTRQGRASVPHQAPVRLHHSALARAGEERRADRHAVRAVGPVDGAPVDDSAARSAPVLRQGHIGRDENTLNDQPADAIETARPGTLASCRNAGNQERFACCTGIPKRRPFPPNKASRLLIGVQAAVVTSRCLGTLPNSDTGAWHGCGLCQR